MADTKISALPAVAAELDADEFACNQAGVTKKETRAQIVSTITAALGTHVGLTAAGVHGSATATGANTLVHRDAAGDADATAFNAAAGAAGTPSHTFTADPNTGHYNYAVDELGVATGGAHRAHWNTTGAVILNDAAASTFMTGPGVTIQQGALDDEAIALQSTDVAHGITTWADTDTYFAARKDEAVAGGARLAGFKDADGFAGGAAVLVGYLGENADTTKTVNGRAIVEVQGYIKSGTTVGDTNADGNVFAVLTRRGGAVVTLLIVDEDADLHVLNDIVVAGLVDGVDVAAHAAATAAGTHGSSVAAGANTLAHRNAAGRSQFVNPAVAQDASTKNYCDTTKSPIGHVHGVGAEVQIVTGGITNDAVDDTKIRNAAATSVIGRAGAGVGDPADIVAGVNDRVLAQAAGTLAFQQVTTAMHATRTVKFFVPVAQGDSALVDEYQGLAMPDGVTTYVYGWSKVPEDFIGGMSVKVLVVANATGNGWVGQAVYFAAVGAAWNLANSSFAAAAVGVVQNQNMEICSIVVAPAVGDELRFNFRRQGGIAGDTIGDILYVAGWVVQYTARS